MSPSSREGLGVRLACIDHYWHSCWCCLRSSSRDHCRATRRTRSIGRGLALPVSPNFRSHRDATLLIAMLFAARDLNSVSLISGSNIRRHQASARDSRFRRRDTRDSTLIRTCTRGRGGGLAITKNSRRAHTEIFSVGVSDRIHRGGILPRISSGGMSGLPATASRSSLAPRLRRPPSRAISARFYVPATTPGWMMTLAHSVDQFSNPAVAIRPDRLFFLGIVLGEHISSRQCVFPIGCIRSCWAQRCWPKIILSRRNPMVDRKPRRDPTGRRAWWHG